MIKHLLTITLRNMTKQKVRSIISILCITAGLLCFSVCHYYSGDCSQNKTICFCKVEKEMLLKIAGTKRDAYML